MKLTVEQKPFAEALARLARIAPGKTYMPILQNALLTAADGRLDLVATNLEIALGLSLAAEVASPGATTLPAKTLADWAALADGAAPIDLAVDGRHKATLVSGGAVTKLSGVAPEEFPPLPDVAGGRSVALDAAALSVGLGRVLHAAAPDIARSVLHCVSFAFADDTLTLAAADGYQLAVCPVALAVPIGEPLALLVPLDAAAELARSLPASGSVELAVTENGNRALATWADARLALPLGAGQFPDWRRLIPPRPTTVATVDRTALDRALQTARLVLDKAVSARGETIPNMAVTFALRPGGSLLIRSRGGDGSHEAELPAEVEGEGLEILLNWRYVRRALAACGTERVSLCCTGPTNVALIRPEPDDGFLGVVMAMARTAAARAAA